VDENWNVKVADFGFARIKEENATMTRCGTPCWTGAFPIQPRLCGGAVRGVYTHLFFGAAPELIRGQRYSEKADIYRCLPPSWGQAGP
jgi:serine/threonine protein kinase